MLATKNTTRVSGVDPIANAAGVALAVFPSAAPGTHPTAVALAPTDDWQAAIAASVLMAPPIRAPLLLSGSGSLPAATSNALGLLAPTGSGAAAGAQVIRIGDVPAVKGFRGAAISGSGPYALAAAIDKFVERRRRQGESRRRDRLGRRPGVRDAGGRVGRGERQSDPVRDRLRDPAANRVRRSSPTRCRTSTSSVRRA